MNPTDESPTDATITLAIPADAAWVRVARLTASGVAAQLGLGLDDIEDLKLAIGEACTDRLETGAARERIALSLRASAECLVVQVEGDAAEPEPEADAEDSYAIALMEALMDQVERVPTDAGRIALRLTLRRPLDLDAAQADDETGVE